MKKKLLILGILGIGILTIKAQEIHTPAEILKIMEKSTISYELSVLENEIPQKDRTTILNYNHYYRINNESKISTHKYEIKDDVQAYLTKAEKYFHDKKFSFAREMYLEVLKADSTYFMVMTYIGQTYGIEGDFDKAIEWYKKTIDLNYIDYMAHWFLADAYKTKGELDNALDEITIAKILNRNNTRIDLSYKEIYALNKLKTDDWTFNPQIKIDSVGTKKVSVSFHSDWLGYAMVKAVWEHEPGYRKSMGVSEGTFSTIEEKECFVSLITSFDKKKLKKNPEFKALQLSLDKKMIDEFIFYEILLPDYPQVAYQLPIDFIIDLKNYVIQVRGKQK